MDKTPTGRARALAASGDISGALEALISADAAGDVVSATELGYWYLRGSPVGRDLVRAKAHFRRAALLGNLEAAAVDIALTANGGWGAPDWSGALAKLRALAPTCDWAKEDLALVDAMDLDGDGYPRTLPARDILDSDLPVVRVSAFVSSAERQHIANRAVDNLERSSVLDPQTGRLIADPVRTSESALIGPAEEDLVLQAIYRRIARATETELRQGEPLTVLRYHPGQEYRPHFDAFRGAGNNRVTTVFIYLNDGYRGGRTLFPDIPLAVEPVAGDVVFFQGLDEHGAVAPAARHAGEPVAQGIKWLATRWIRARPFDPWTASEAAS